MPTKKVFYDENNNEMDCYINDKGKVFIQIGETEAPINEKNYIVLDKNDVKEFIEVLQEIEKDMQ